MNPSIRSAEIRLIREKLKLTQREFGHLFGLSESMINRIEKGSRNFPELELPKMEELKRRIQAAESGLFAPPVPVVSDASNEVLRLESELCSLKITLKRKEHKLILLEKQYFILKMNLTIFSPERNLVYDEKSHLRKIKSSRKSRVESLLAHAPEQLKILRFRIEVLSYSVSKLEELIQSLKAE